jgi:hypothetical protein
MKAVLWRVAGLATTLSLVAAMPAAAQQATTRAVLTLPVAGTFSGGGEFTGSISRTRGSSCLRVFVVTFLMVAFFTEK